ncbi:MAG: GTP-binding protein [Elusimicrobia bacterium]|nr:GTP-binding protein [Elusimicrobiota bacterium]
MQFKQSKPIKINLVAGFLGSGKTTLVRHFLRHSGSEKIGVLLNELGEVALDKDPGGRVVEFAQGCLCCQSPNELVLSLKALARKAPDRILIESTGIAEPSRILKTLADAPSLRKLITIEPTIVVVDAAGFFSLFQTLAYYYVMQLRASDVVVLNKADVATKAQLAGAEKEVRKIQPRALVVRARHARVDLRGILEGEPSDRPSGFQTQRVGLDGTLDPAGLRAFLEGLPGGIYRAKGRVRFPGGSHRIQYLSGSYAEEPLREALERPANDIVFIGTKVDRPALEAKLKRCVLPQRHG